MLSQPTTALNMNITCISQSDMYSIGVLAFELFQPFGTEMERVQILGELRDGKIPESFSHRWPLLTKYIMKLTSTKPRVRPTASQLLQSELFYSKDMVCTDICLYNELNNANIFLCMEKKSY